jgi:hypothetical protein
MAKKIFEKILDFVKVIIFSRVHVLYAVGLLATANKNLS